MKEREDHGISKKTEEIFQDNKTKKAPKFGAFL